MIDFVLAGTLHLNPKSLRVVVNYLNIPRRLLMPPKAQPILAIDADTVLSSPVTA